MGRNSQTADILKVLWKEDDLQVFGEQKLCLAMCHFQSQLETPEASLSAEGKLLLQPGAQGGLAPCCPVCRG